MNYYVISDTHLGHRKMLEYCGRPDKFEQLILENLQLQLTYDDVLIHLGDVAFSRGEYWNNMITYALPGKKWLILGNHDHETTNWYIKRGWDCVCQEMLLDVYGKKVLLAHHPPKSQRDGVINVFGHLHDKGTPQYLAELGYDASKNKCVSLELNNYSAVSLESLVG